MLNIQPLSLKSVLEHPDFVEGDHWFRKHYQAEELIIVEGEKGNEIYVILSGKVSVCTHVKVSKDRHMLSGLCELFDGEEFSHACFFDNEPHSATVKAIASCELAIIKSDKLQHFLESHTEIGYRLLFHWIKIILPRIRQGNKRFSSLFSWGLKAHQIDTDI